MDAEKPAAAILKSDKEQIPSLSGQFHTRTLKDGVA